MTFRRTYEFLPTVFQSDTNRKFLAATLDQLVSEPDMTRINGYIGRKFAPTYKTTDNYIEESSSDRQNYQLEPSIVIKNKKEIDFYSGYTDLINKISYYGGFVNDHNRLFQNEYYTYNGHFDFDKFVNYNQYYWLPNGPLPVTVTSGIVASQSTFNFATNVGQEVYEVEGYDNKNPDLILIRGGRYKFKSNATNGKLWLQTEPGVTGFKKSVPNISCREIYNLNNNGNGTEIDFLVPLADSQEEFLKMPMLPAVDFALDIKFSDLDGISLSALNNQLDGYILNPDSKTLIFLTDSNNDSDWTSANGDVVNENLRRGVWRIRIITTRNGKKITLDYLRNIDSHKRIYSKMGKTHANKEFYKNSLGQFVVVPPLTAHLDVLYYQNDLYPEMTGKIKIIDSAVDSINVDNEIIGKLQYTSTQGVTFTNGLVVTFDDTVQPARYQNKTYIVEGIGSAIKLIDFDSLVSPEPDVSVSNISYDSDNYNLSYYEESFIGPAEPDYVTINRASKDLNAWSRQNRWFHIDVLLASSKYNGTIPMLDQAIRAQRPIIEFDPDLQLINNGIIGKVPVDIIDSVTTDAFNQVQHQPTLLINGDQLREGQRILFVNDKDPLVRTQIYTVQFQIQNEPAYNSIYDGTGTGAIFIESPVLNCTFASPIEFIETVTENNAQKFYYSVAVQGRKILEDAVELTGLNYPYDAISGAITGVSQSQIGYVYTFYTTEALTSLSTKTVKLKSNKGISTVVGYQTKFLSELTPGAAIYSFDQYLGTVASILSDERLQLANAAPRKVVSEQFSYITPKIQLKVSADSDDTIETNDCIVAKSGANKGKSYWFDGTAWQLAQTKVNKSAPLFEIYDNNNVSYTQYPSSKFKGSKIFSYKIGTGSADPILGFPLSYSTGSSYYNVNLADISFENNFGSDTFEYLLGSSIVTSSIDNGYIRKNISRTEFEKKNVWNKVNESSKQYQIISKTFDGTTNYFEIDVEQDIPVYAPNVKVFLNNVLLEETKYQYNVVVGNRRSVVVNSALLTVGDKIDLLIYSKSTSKIGYYQIPSNLDFNSKNISFNTLSLGQIRNNLIAIRQNLQGLVGDVPGSSNIRDLDIKHHGGNILQHSAPIIYADVFLINDSTNFVDSIDLARREYTKFKNKFIELAGSMQDLDHSDPIAGVDKILASINLVKNINFPYYYSDMVPFGNCIKFDYEVLDPNQKQYKISSSFNNSVLQNRAVLIYLNHKQLVQNLDYTFDSIRPAFVLSDRLSLSLGDIITVRDYENTDANYVPPTPTKLGLYPKFKPEIYLDTTYREPIEVIQGHDGSITPSFGDFRDEFLLELELRIFNNIKNVARSIDINQYIPGRFRKTDYSVGEFTTILNSNFLKWIGTNRLDYLANSAFNIDDPFTYNYNSSTDTIFAETLPGYWRGIYKYFYDTDRPHTHPWEMLGFTEKPVWWDETYGPAPYTSNNDLLWSDLELGKIRSGSRQGIDAKYARPNLKRIIPVDESGGLIPPIGKIAAQFNSIDASDNFEIGDGAPAESAWKRTSEYPFAIQYALAITKPALYFGTLFDLADYFYDTEYKQFVVKSTNRRVTPGSIRIHGLNVDGEIQRTSGYINWVVDYMTSLGLSAPTKLKAILDSIEVQLAYKLAGYTDKKYLTVLAEQYSPTSINESIIIPDDSYNVVLNKSVPIERIAYSAVIIEKTNNGYSVSGYNKNYPYFAVVPSDPAGESTEIVVDDFVGIIYTAYQKQKALIPYGYEFTSKQQVVDFLISYQRYLFAQGFIFEEYSEDLGMLKNWELSCREFLFWSTQGWRPGAIIIVSPINDTLSVLSSEGVIDAITNKTNGSRLLDPNFNVIKLTDITVLREDGLFKLKTTSGQTIAFAELNLIQFEHVLIFDNLTIFSDVIYKPESGSRQYRLKLVGRKTANWDGSLNPAGFVYNSNSVASWQQGKDYLKGDIVDYKNQYFVATQKVAGSTTFDLGYWKLIDKNEVKTGLLPNWANAAQRFIDIYDADSSLLDNQLAKMSAGLIGFRNRYYLNDLNVNSTSQLKFYQGYIKEKGTKNSIENLTNAQFSSLENDVTVYEEWAFRVGDYGATKINQTIELEIDESLHQNNPTGLAVVSELTNSPTGLVPVLDRLVYNRTSQRPVKFLNRDESITRENDIQTAGYVYPDDVDFTLFDSDDLESLNQEIDNIYSGYTVWVAKDKTKDWDVYRLSETDCTVEKMKYCLDGAAEITVNERHNLAVGQIIAVKNFNTTYNRFYVVSSIIDIHTFSVELDSTLLTALRQQPVSGSGLLFKFTSVRLESADEVDTITPRHGWKDGDHIWVDSDESGKWAAYKKQDAWSLVGGFGAQLGVINNESAYGTSVRIAPEQNYIVVGAPGDVQGAGRIYVFNNDDNFTERGVIQGGLTSVAGLGHSVDLAAGLLIAGAPRTDDSSGIVVVYTNLSGVYFEPVQIILNPEVPLGSEFGSSVSVSNDGHWLYIGSPASNQVHLYKRTSFRYRSNVFKLNKTNNTCLVPYVIEDPRALAVFIQGKLKILNRDYTIEENTIVINSLLTAQNANTFMLESGEVFESETVLDSSDYITVIQTDYYAHKHTYTYDEEFARFGHVVKSSGDGSRVIVGAPNSTVGNIVEAGRTFVLWNTMGATPELRLVEEIPSEAVAYSSHFGTSVDICADNCNLYVGSPGYSTAAYSGGLVNRYINEGNMYGVVVGKTIDPVITPGDSIYINGIEVTFNGQTLDDAITAVNNAEIVGVTATKEAGILILQARPENNKITLDIAPGNGTAFADLGLQVYTLAQQIRQPMDRVGENFGSQLRISGDAQTLMVASTRGTVKTEASLDVGTTLFDGKATRFLDITLGSGTVYAFDYLPSGYLSNQTGRMIFGQEFNAPNIKINDHFGNSIDFTDNQLFIGAAFNDERNVNAGNVYEYKNKSGLGGWIKHRKQVPSVDVHSINYVGLFNKKTKSKLTNLDYIDPIKGKNLGIVEQNLTYKTSIDPASYNAGTSVQEQDFHWGATQVGQTWWDLDQVRYIVYEQDELIFRMNNWGAYFPGSQFHVYEWVESSVLPSAWVQNGNSGVPLYEDDSAYVVNTYIDTDTGLVKTLYYYWVRGITEVGPSINRALSSRSLEIALEAPRLQGIPYAAILSDRSVALFNCGKFFDGQNTLLKIDYDSKKNDSVIHSEYSLVREGSKDSLLPKNIVDKIVDSLSSIDKKNQRVPDYRINESQRLGINFKPRQTLFNDRFLALKNLVQYLNSIFAKNTIAYKLQNSKIFANSNFFSSDKYPSASEYDHVVETLDELEYVVKTVGDKILVKKDSYYYNLWTVYQVKSNEKLKLVKNQSFNTSLIWKYSNWYKQDYSYTNKTTYEVDFFKDVAKLDLFVGDTIKVRKSSTGGFEIYRVKSDADLELVGVENGTIQLNEEIWNVALSGIGYENRGYEGATYDIDLGKEIRNIMIGLAKEVLIDELAQNYNEMLFVVIKYILSEQSNVDWMFKTSFISVIHNIRQLAQYPNYVRDNHEYFEDYISEVKPYRTKIREYKLGYRGIDNAYADITDFDLPAYYDKKLKRFRSPSGEIAGDDVLLQSDQYADWSNHVGFYIERIVISNPGRNYRQPPIVTIIANNDGGSGATAQAVVDEDTGAIVQILVTNKGQGYTRTPIVLINGDGIGAKAHAQLRNDQLRSLKTTMKFDRLSYTSQIKDWKPNLSYVRGQYVTYLGKAYKVEIDHSADSFNSLNFVLVDLTIFNDAADRVAAAYSGGKYQIPKESDENGNINLSRLIPGTGYLRNVVDTDPTIYNESATESWRANQRIEGNDPLDINVTGGFFYDEGRSHAPEELIPGNLHDSLSLMVQTDVPEQNAQYRWRINQDQNGKNEYFILSILGVTVLTQDLNYDDTRIYVQDISTLMVPNRLKKIYGTLNINGEKIRYWQVDTEGGYVTQLTRGVDGTGTPETHYSGTTVENQGNNFRIPQTSRSWSEDYFFDAESPVFTPIFEVEDSIDNVKLNLQVFNNNTNLLTLDKDYTVDIVNIDSINRVAISFIRADSMANGVRIKAVYSRDYIWYNPGIDAPADGTGLAGTLSNPVPGSPAEFIQKNPYKLL